MKKNIEKKLNSLIEIKLEKEKNNSISKDMSYISRFMCFAGLPHSKIPGHVFHRAISFGASQPVSLKILSEYGIPYGIWARRLLAYICQQAVRNKNNQTLNTLQKRTIDLGSTQADFLRLVKKSDILATGGKNGSLTAIHEQARRLFSSSIKVESVTQKKWSFKNSLFAEEGMIFWESELRNIWEGRIILSQSFYDDIVQNAVPIESVVIKNLRSALTFDIYLWLRWKTHHLKKDTYISWNQLFEQFGYGYANTAQGKINFRRDFLSKAREIKLIDTNNSFLWNTQKFGLVFIKKQAS